MILASVSKRRSEILSSCNISHRVMVSGAVEIEGLSGPVSDIVRKNASLKARKVDSMLDKSGRGKKAAVIIAADTLVRVGKRIIGKPKDKDDAVGILRLLSGKKADVVTGLYVIDRLTGRAAGAVDKSSIRVTRLGEEDIQRFLAVLGPYDKAGGFSIEGPGSLLFDDIRGSYFNILGLPMIALRRLFARIGLDLLDYIKR